MGNTSTMYVYVYIHAVILEVTVEIDGLIAIMIKHLHNQAERGYLELSGIVASSQCSFQFRGADQPIITIYMYIYTRKKAANDVYEREYWLECIREKG